MKCYKHYDKDAVSTCLDCGKALCPTCSEKFNQPLCDNCALSRISNNKQLLIKNSVIMIVLAIIGFMIYAGEEGFMFALFGALVFAGIPWGWSVLNKITPNIFLFMPIIGWIIYFLVKLIFSMFIGIFVTPFKIYKIIKGLKEAKELEIYTKEV